MILKLTHLARISAAIVLLVRLSLPHASSAANYTYSYWLLDQPDGSSRYELTVSVTSSLYEYYQSKDHDLYSLDFSKFVTPYALKPMADSLWSIYTDVEDFANGVLMIVHQIPYKESAPQGFPVETIAQNEGDCDLFSFVAASVMIAGGLDVVLFYYEVEKHMTVGVYLSSTPNDARSEVYYIDYNGKPYYMAETTGDSWEKGWRVGECPDELKDASAQIITLENAEQSSPGQVSASYSVLASSSISLRLSTPYTFQGSIVTASGQLSPAGPNKSVTIYAGKGNSQWGVLGTATTDSDGKFSFLWIPRSASTYYIRASWSGNADYAGSDSGIHRLMVLPFDLTFISILSVVTAGVILVAVLAVMLKRRTPPEETFSDTEAVETSI